MITYFSILAALVITGMLGVYGFSCLGLLLFGALKGKRHVDTLHHKNQSKVPINVLICSHNESVGALEAIKSIEHQSYKANKNVYLLLADSSDNSIPLLEKEYNHSFKNTTNIKLDNNILLHVVFCGVVSKKEKLQYVLDDLKAGYTAILDADHKADKDWLLVSAKFLDDYKRYECVQGRRAPLSVKNVFQLWDSAQNHVGNEMFSRALQSHDVSAFFTGTTALFRTKTLQSLGFSNCVTEDTYLSYQMLLKNGKIGHLPDTGSREEIAPNVKSYVSRRRRWSTGHNQTFFQNVGSIVRTAKPFRQKLAMLFHGIFYFIPILVVLLMAILATFTFLQYDLFTKAMVILVSLLFSVLLNYVTGKYGVRGFDVLGGFIWTWSQVTIWTTYWLFFIRSDKYFYLSNFPYLNEWLGDLQLVLVVLPLVILGFSLCFIKLFPLRKVLLLILSYPIFIFLDIYATLLGVIDFLLGEKYWPSIARTHIDDDQDIKRLSLRQILKRGSIGLLIFLGLYGVNVLTAKPNCGEPYSMAYVPKFLLPQGPNDWKPSLDIKPLNDTKKIQVSFTGDLKTSVPVEGLSFELDGQLQALNLHQKTSQEGSYISTYNHQVLLPMGFESKTATLRINDDLCHRVHEFPTTAKAIKGEEVFINGEPFLVKGVVTSFDQSKFSFSLSESLKEIKDLGANLIRTYHTPSSKFVTEVQNQHLFLLPQTNQSNWSNTNISTLFGKTILMSRYRDLQRDFYKYPFVFLVNFGNEMELYDHELIPRIETLIKEAKQEPIRNFLSYSTYLVFVNYPAEILGINMLDTGSTYWDKAVSVIKKHRKPFIATELGGFTAFFETTNPYLRSYRLMNQWDRLMANNAVGAIIFQSHDDWGQPVPEGYNDPFRSEQPDDLRGIWTKDRKPKLIKHVVEALFADMEVSIDHSHLEGVKALNIRLRNKRKYALNDIQLTQNEEIVKESFSLNPSEVRSVQIPMKALTLGEPVWAQYQTHQGIQSAQKIDLPTLGAQALPFIENDFWLPTLQSANRLEGVILEDSVRGFLPKNWKMVSPKPINQPGRFQVENVPPVLETVDLKISSDEKVWQNWGPQNSMKNVTLKFKFARPVQSGDLLLIDGLGAVDFKLYSSANSKRFQRQSHIYRQEVIPLDRYVPVGFDGYFFIRLVRDRTTYLFSRDAPDGKAVSIDLGKPLLFAPQKIVIEKK